MIGGIPRGLVPILCTIHCEGIPSFYVIKLSSELCTQTVVFKGRHLLLKFTYGKSHMQQQMHPVLHLFYKILQ